MGRRIFFTILILLTTVAGLSAQTVLKTLKISTKDFSTTQGTPRIVRNGFDHQWLSPGDSKDHLPKSGADRRIRWHVEISEDACHQSQRSSTKL